uniref:DUF4795 domain-containing protein n=1 Tax=Anopheles maculatus TaxID=74869 RepID=A0A182SEA3_9DIPT
MVSSSESDGVLGEGLNRLLGEAFGTSGSGRINIKALHQLLRNLIDLHVRYEDEKQQFKLIHENDVPGVVSMQITPTKDVDTLPRDKPAAVPEIEVRLSEKSDGDKIATQPKETTAPTEKAASESVDRTKEDGPNAKDKLAITTVAEDDAPNAIQAVEEQSIDKPKERSGDVSTNVIEESPKNSTEHTKITIGQRSSDFLTNSTTSSSEKSGSLSSSTSHTTSTGAKSAAGSGGKKFPSTPVAVDKQIPAKERSTQTANEFETILEGCRSHLEAVKEEILTLKARCQSQHEDVLKLAGGLDNLSYRVGSQEPKVEKLETDTHCLGMLVSDYEVNFKRIANHLERHDMKVQEFERAFQRMDKERDALRADLRSANEQVSYLATVKADKVDVQTELNRRALVTDMEQRVPYTTFNEAVRDLSRTITALREDLHDVEQNLKTVQYELVKGLDAKASAQDVSQIRKQLVGALSRCQRIEKDHQASVVIMGDTCSAAVASKGGISSDTSKCLTCGIQTTLEGNQPLVPAKFIPVNRIRHGTRNAGGIHTKCVPPEKVFRTGSLGVVKKVAQDEKRSDQHWKL